MLTCAHSPSVGVGRRFAYPTFIILFRITGCIANSANYTNIVLKEKRGYMEKTMHCDI